MTHRRLTTMSWLLAALMVFPLASFAGELKAEACPSVAPTAQSYTGDFSQEAKTLLDGVRADALNIRANADRLNRLVETVDQYDWQLHANALVQIESGVNDMGSKLCRLEEIRSSVTPWQKAAIDDTIVANRLLTDNTADAIAFVNAHEVFPWSEAYHANVDNILSEATTLDNTIGNYDHLAKLRREEMHARSEIDMGNGHAS